MTLGEARRRLRFYYQALEDEGISRRSTDIVILGGVGRAHSSPTERAAVARADILRQIEPVHRAVMGLNARQQEWLWLRYGKELKFKTACRMLGLRHTAAARMDSMALAAFIALMGEKVEEEGA
jgi:DNA-directed RNA polymerase specialized sigma24 family protein